MNLQPADSSSLGSLLLDQIFPNRQDHVTANSIPKVEGDPEENSSSICHQCQKIVPVQNRLYHLFQHLSQSKGIYQYACNRCAYGSNTLSHIKRHSRTHFGADDEFVNRIETNSEDLKEMSLLCYNSPVVIKPTMHGNNPSSSASRLRASWPYKKRENRRAASSVNPTQLFFNIPDDRMHFSMNWADTRNTFPSGSDFIEVEKKQFVDEIKTEIDDEFGSEAQSVTSEALNNATEIMFPNAEENPFNTLANESSLASCSRSNGNGTSSSYNQKVTPGEDDAFFEKYRFQAKWSTKELVENFRIVAEKLECSTENVDRVVEVLEKNCMNGFALSCEDENLSRFIRRCNIAYGVEVVMIQVLKKMKLKSNN